MWFLLCFQSHHPLLSPCTHSEHSLFFFFFNVLLHYSLVLPVACLMGGLHAHVIILPSHLQKAIFCPGTFRHKGPIAACCEITVKLLIMTKGPLLTWCGTLVKRVCVAHWWLVRLARKSRVGLGCKWKLFETS